MISENVFQKCRFNHFNYFAQVYFKYFLVENTTEPLQNSSNDANPTVFPEIDSTENLTTGTVINLMKEVPHEKKNNIKY